MELRGEEELELKEKVCSYNYKTYRLSSLLQWMWKILRSEILCTSRRILNEPSRMSLLVVSVTAVNFCFVV